MATPPNLVQLSFAAGLDESKQAEVLDPSAGFPVLQNLRQPVVGAAEKRLGFGALTKNRLSGSRSAGYKLFAHNGVPCVIDGSQLDCYVDAASLNVTRCRVPECTYSSVTVPGPSPTAIVWDVEYCNSLIAVSAGSGLTGNAQVQVVEASTGAVVRSYEQVGGATNAYVLLASCSSRYLFAFIYTAAGNVDLYSLDTQSVSSGWSSVASVVAGAGGAAPVVCSMSDRVAIAYGTTSGTNRIAVKTYNQSGLLQSTTINTASTTANYAAIHGSTTGTLWVAWNQGTSIKACGLNPTTITSTVATTATPITTPTTPSGLHICEGSSAGTARVMALSNDATTKIQTQMCGLTTSAGAAVAGTSTTVYNVIPSGKPFQQNSRYYVPCYSGATSIAINTGNAQGLCIVADWTDDEPFWKPVANMDPGLVTLNGFTGKCSSAGSGRFVFGYMPTKNGLVNASSILDGDSSVGVQLVTLDYATRKRWQTASHCRSTFIGGSCLTVFDGDRVTEAGFLVKPNKPTTTTSGTGLSPSIGYRYVAVFEDVDASGNWAVSGISDPTDVVQPVNQTVNLSVPPLSVSWRLTKHPASAYDSTVRVAWYRTTDGGVAPYYRLGATTVDPSDYQITFADATTDATLTTKAKLYAPNLPSTPNEALDRRAPPGLTNVVSYNGMLVGSVGETLYYSGQDVYGEATWFSPVFQVPVSGGGDITALAVQDGTVYAFKRASIFALSGDAPSDNGTSGGLVAPRRLAVDFGCVDPNSLVVTSLGVFFQSDRGMCLLDRSGDVSFLGFQIQNTAANYPVVSSAVLDQRSNLVRFTFAASESSGLVSGGGRDAIYDLTLKQWVSVDTRYGSTSGEAAQSAAYVYTASKWRYAWLGTDGTLYTERDKTDGSAYLDGSTWVTMAAETGSFKQGGIQGRQMLNSATVLARKSTDFDLSASLAYNYETSFRTARTFSHTEISGLLSAGWPVTQLKHAPHDDAECQGVRVRIADATPTSGTVGNGKGATWIALTLDITPQPGVFDVPEGAI